MHSRQDRPRKVKKLRREMEELDLEIDFLKERFDRTRQLRQLEKQSGDVPEPITQLYDQLTDKKSSPWYSMMCQTMPDIGPQVVAGVAKRRERAQMDKGKKLREYEAMTTIWDSEGCPEDGPGQSRIAVYYAKMKLEELDNPHLVPVEGTNWDEETKKLDRKRKDKRDKFAMRKAKAKAGKQARRMSFQSQSSGEARVPGRVNVQRRGTGEFDPSLSMELQLGVTIGVPQVYERGSEYCWTYSQQLLGDEFILNLNHPTKSRNEVYKYYSLAKDPEDPQGDPIEFGIMGIDMMGVVNHQFPDSVCQALSHIAFARWERRREKLGDMVPDSQAWCMNE